MSELKGNRIYWICGCGLQQSSALLKDAYRRSLTGVGVAKRFSGEGNYRIKNEFLWRLRHCRGGLYRMVETPEGLVKSSHAVLILYTLVLYCTILIKLVCKWNVNPWNSWICIFFHNICYDGIDYSRPNDTKFFIFSFNIRI